LPRNGEQHVVEARGFLDRGRRRTSAKLGDAVDECTWTTPAAQDHFMAPGQRLSPECERDSAGADRSKLHTYAATRTISLPKLSPSSIPMKAPGAFSRPSTMSSR